MQAPGSSQEAILPARAVADAPFSALAARLDDLGHRRAEVTRWVRQWEEGQGERCVPIFSAPKNRGSQFLIPTQTWYIYKKKGTIRGKQLSNDLAVTSFNISCFLIPGFYGSCCIYNLFLLEVF